MTTETLRVKEISVKADFKSWGQRFNSDSGDSSGTDISWTVAPNSSTHPEGWTVEEALMVTLEVRKKQQALLTLDAQARGVDPPHGGGEAVENYKVILGQTPPKVEDNGSTKD